MAAGGPLEAILGDLRLLALILPSSARLVGDSLPPDYPLVSLLGVAASPGPWPSAVVTPNAEFPSFFSGGTPPAPLYAGVGLRGISSMPLPCLVERATD